MHKILFVCLGNICRSPTAEGVFRKAAKAAELSFECDGAGTSDWHIGHPPDLRAQAEAQRRDVDLAGLRARQITEDDFHHFDLIIAMDSDNLRDIEALRPAGSLTPVRLLLEYAPHQPLRDVPDPYYTHGFDGVFDLIELASKGLIRQLLDGAQTSAAARPHSL